VKRCPPASCRTFDHFWYQPFFSCYLYSSFLRSVIGRWNITNTPCSKTLDIAIYCCPTYCSHFPNFNKTDTGCRGCNEFFSFDKILHPPIEGLCLKYAATINSSVLSVTCFSIHEVPAQSCSNAQTRRSTCSSRY